MQCSKNNPLLDNLVGAGDQGRRHLDAERPSSAGINHQLELRWQLNRQIGWLLTLENPAYVGAGHAIAFVGIRSITYQTTAGDEFAAKV